MLSHLPPRASPRGRGGWGSTKEAQPGQPPPRRLLQGPKRQYTCHGSGDPAAPGSVMRALQPTHPTGLMSWALPGDGRRGRAQAEPRARVSLLTPGDPSGQGPSRPESGQAPRGVSVAREKRPMPRGAGEEGAQRSVCAQPREKPLKQEDTARSLESSEWKAQRCRRWAA